MRKVEFILKGKKREQEFSSPHVASEFIKRATQTFGNDFAVAPSAKALENMPVEAQPAKTPNPTRSA